MHVRYPPIALSKWIMDIVGPFVRGPAESQFRITLVHYHSKWTAVYFSVSNDEI